MSHPTHESCSPECHTIHALCMSPGHHLPLPLSSSNPIVSFPHPSLHDTPCITARIAPITMQYAPIIVQKAIHNIVVEVKPAHFCHGIKIFVETQLAEGCCGFWVRAHSVKVPCMSTVVAQLVDLMTGDDDWCQGRLFWRALVKRDGTKGMGDYYCCLS